MCTGFDPWCSHVAWLQSPSRTGWFLPGLPDTMYISRFVPSVRSTRFHHDGAYRGLKCEHHCTLFVPRGSLRQYNAFAHAPNYPLESRKKTTLISCRKETVIRHVFVTASPEWKVKKLIIRLPIVNDLLSSVEIKLQ